MKKCINVLIIGLFVAGLFFAGAVKPVSAFLPPPPPPVASGVADGSWTWASADVTGSEMTMDMVMPHFPAWLQLLTNGLMINGPARICHPFRGGQFGWVGEIRMHKGDEWVKLPTTNEWIPTVEGQFMSCATVPSAGMYALFGYYVKPAIVEQERILE